MKKFILPMLILTIMIQLFVPAYMVYEKHDTLKTGAEYKFEVELYSSSSDNFVSIYAKSQRNFQYAEQDGKYGLIAVDNDGYAYINSTSNTKPLSGDYIKSSSVRYFALPIERYYPEDEISTELENLTFNNSKNLHPYVILRVKNGNSVIQGVYIDDVRIEDYLK